MFTIEIEHGCEAIDTFTVFACFSKSFRFFLLILYLRLEDEPPDLLIEGFKSSLKSHFVNIYLLA